MSGRVVALSDYRGTPRLRAAIEAFFSDKQLSANTRRTYSQALWAIADGLGGNSPVDQLDSRMLLNVFQGALGIGAGNNLEHPDHRRQIVHLLLPTQRMGTA